MLSRPSRFLVVARLAGRRVTAACRDPGRLSELLVPGVRLLLAAAARRPRRRRTAYTVVLAKRGGAWVSVVPALANDVLAAALVRDGAAGLRGARILAREVVRGRSRFDFLLHHRGRVVLAEVKSATLVEGGCALFPDAPTARGARQVRELARLGPRALVVFVVQRSDADRLAPHAGIDANFARTLRAARRAGVRLLAYACRISPRGIALARRIPVVI